MAEFHTKRRRRRERKPLRRWKLHPVWLKLAELAGVVLAATPGRYYRIQPGDTLQVTPAPATCPWCGGPAQDWGDCEDQVRDFEHELLRECPGARLECLDLRCGWGLRCSRLCVSTAGQFSPAVLAREVCDCGSDGPWAPIAGGLLCLQCDKIVRDGHEGPCGCAGTIAEHNIGNGRGCRVDATEKKAKKK